MSVQTDSATPRYRPATIADLTEIEHLLTDSGLPVDGVADIIGRHPDDFVVAEADGSGQPRLVGVGGLEVCCNNALLRSVAVRPDWQTHGIGRDLVRRLVRTAEARGIRALYLLTQTAEHYFPRFGFETVERQSVPPEIAETLEFKSACPASAVAMAKTLA